MILLERAILVGLKTKENRFNFDNSIEELKNLSRTAGAEVIEVVVQERKAPDPATFIGKGKVEEISLSAKDGGADMLVIDHELSPTQQRNLEEKTGLKVIDRTALILDIFATHANTKTGKLQVRLAQYNYFLPRLTRMWTHLSRIGGLIGTRGPGRGPGETQLEVDRRRILNKINRMKKQLEKVSKERRTQRKQRMRSGVFKIVLVGYTNSGKSTLINALVKAGVKVEDQLFSTLDPTTRKIIIDRNQAIVTDTVGFIDNLPHQLIEAFKSTLEEVVEADLLVKVSDGSASNLEERMEVVDKVLGQIGAKSRSLEVINKIDLLDEEEIEGLKTLFPSAIFISAAKGEGLAELKQEIARQSKATA